jgi:acetoin utilization protein AcuB
MNVSDIMTAHPTTVQPHHTLRHALETMQRVGCHHLPVLSVERHLVGILSDRDCRTALNSPYTLREGWQDENLIDQLLVGAVMTPAPIVIEPNAFAEEAARLMLANQINCLPVLRGETLIGIVTSSDVLSAFVRMCQRESLRNSTAHHHTP